MNGLNDTGVVAGPASGQTSHTHRLRGLAGTGFIATLAAMVATTLAAALARAVGVDFEVPDGGETIPLSGFAVVTGFFSVVGIVIAAGLLRWSARPAERFVRTAVSLVAISLVPPLLSESVVEPLRDEGDFIEQCLTPRTVQADGVRAAE
jgi:hypothetical protein